MFRYPKLAIQLTTACLVAAALLPSTSYTALAATLAFLVGPLMVAWMALSVLKEPNVKVPELQRGDEWGYADAQHIRPVRVEDVWSRY